MTSKNDNSDFHAMMEMAQRDNAHPHWRVSKTPEQQGVDKKGAFEALASHRMRVGHALQAIAGENFESAREHLIETQKAIAESLKKLGHKA